MNLRVVDASVALKWLLAEESTDKAEALPRDALDEGATLVGPPHLPGDVANALYRRVLRTQNSITQTEAAAALASFLALPVRIVDPDGLYARACTFAVRAGLPSLDDSSYVVLAHLLSADLWTADRHLPDSLGGRVPWVRAIGDN